MRRAVVLFFWLIFAVPCWAQNAQHAVLRIFSHGASGTVVQTSANSTFILTCAHAFKGADRSTPIKLDVPSTAPTGTVQVVRPTLVAVDYQLDLALIHLRAGPLPYVCPVAPSSAIYSRRCLSVGYDEMKLPPTVRTATVLRSQGEITYTAEKPWHGRSGGALIDDRGQLVGVVQGYEVDGRQRGMYASHDAILAFLRSQALRERYVPQSPPVRYSPPPGCLPGGT